MSVRNIQTKRAFVYVQDLQLRQSYVPNKLSNLTIETDDPTYVGAPSSYIHPAGTLNASVKLHAPSPGLTWPH